MATQKATAQQHYRLRLVREGLEFEVEGDRNFVLEMIKQFVTTGTPSFTPASVDIPKAGKTKGGSPPLTIASFKGLSVREFILQLESRKHTDMVLAFGYYLEKHSGQSAFAPADLNNLYYEAKLDTSNTSQMIIQNIKRGYMMEAKKGNGDGKKQQYVVTNSGEKYIEGLLTASHA